MWRTVPSPWPRRPTVGPDSRGRNVEWFSTYISYELAILDWNLVAHKFMVGSLTFYTHCIRQLLTSFGNVGVRVVWVLVAFAGSKAGYEVRP